MSRRYRIGIIGAGARAGGFAKQLHQTISRAELFGVHDIDAGRLNHFIEKNELAGAQPFTDLDAMLARTDLDAVLITAPEFVHRELTVKALQAGKPVYLEKPLAHTIEDSVAILEAQRQTGVVAYVGFNLRAAAAYLKLRQIVQSGILGQIIHIAGVEQLHVAHIASFMRRFHRHSALNGGLLNTKCCHDLDIMRWLIGVEHQVVKVSSFGGLNIFTPDKQPATHCHLCPASVYDRCPYAAPESDKLRRGTLKPLVSQNQDHYPGDLCVYTPDKDLVDNQTVIMEWDHGVRGSFQLQGFQHQGTRMTRIWGERGVLDFDGLREPHVTITDSAHGDVDTAHFAIRTGGHGGVDNLMIDRFLDAIERGDAGDSGIREGLAASIIAIKADESRLTGQTVSIPMELYDGKLAV